MAENVGFCKKVKRWADRNIRPFLYVSLILCFVLEVWLFVFASDVIQEKYLLSSTIFLSAIMATCGWMWSGHINRRLSRKQHAVTVLLPLLEQNVNDWKKEVYAYIDSNEANKSIPMPQTQLLLGYYEFIAICAMNDTADEEVIRESERLVFKKLYEGMHEHIKQAQVKDKSIYCHLEKAAIEWNDGVSTFKEQYVKKEGEFFDHH